MVKRYYEKELVTTNLVKIYNCPDCGFEFNAMHEVDERVGGWECPLCEVDELQKEVETLKKCLNNAANDILIQIDNIEEFENEQFGVSKDALFESWIEELGYSKAVLLSCNYSVRKVIEMSLEEAESEVEAIEG